MFFKLKEAGKKISAETAKKIQNIHDTTVDLGGGCGLGLSGMYESAKFKEAALPMTTSHDALRGHIRGALQVAHGNPKDSYGYPDGPYVHDVFPSHVVYSHKGQTYRRKYTALQGGAGSDPTIALSGEPKKVHTAYVDSADESKEAIRVYIEPSDKWVEDRDFLTIESVTVTGEGLVEVQESGDSIICMSIEEFAVVREANKAQVLPIKVIAPGWGSSAYYSKEVLQRDGPKVFAKGTHMMWNHQTTTEESERPEGDLSDLAAVLVENAKWDDAGAKGPGLYAKAKVFSDYAQQVSEKGPHIGVSINAGVKCHEGEAEGRTGRIADQFVKAFSIDFVTKAGAGGAPLVPVQESDRRNPTKELIMTEKEIQDLQAQLKESEDKRKALEAESTKNKEAELVTSAITEVTGILKEAGIEVSAKLIQRSCSHPTIKEGKLDPEFVKGVVADLSEGQTGKVKGLGTGTAKATETVTEAETKAFSGYLQELGVPEAGLTVAVKGRN